MVCGAIQEVAFGCPAGLPLPQATGGNTYKNTVHHLLPSGAGESRTITRPQLFPGYMCDGVTPYSLGESVHSVVYDHFRDITNMVTSQPVS